MEKKKATRDQLERKLRNAVVLVPRDKDYLSVYFDDKGLRLEVTADTTVISTNYHKHVFDRYVPSMLMDKTVDSRPYLFTKRIIEYANENEKEIIVEADGENMRSFTKLLEVLKNKEDKTQFYIASNYDMWLFNIFMPLYSIGETEAESFLLYESYMHNIARQSVILGERKEAVTNKAFVKRVTELLTEFTSDVEESVVLEQSLDEQDTKSVKEENEARLAQEQETLMQETLNEQ